MYNRFITYKTISTYMEKMFRSPNGLTHCTLHILKILFYFFFLSELNLSGDQKFPSRNKMDNLCFDQLNPTTDLAEAKPSFPTHLTCVSVSVCKRIMKPKGSYYVTDEKLQSVTHMCFAI